MGTRWILGLVGMIVATTVSACQTVTEEAIGGSSSRVTGTSFDKNSVLSDAALRDVSAMSTEDVQAFLEKTPWGHASILSAYEEDGKSAALIIHDAAKSYGINPLALLVRVQTEQSLVYKESASESSVFSAFGCGCPSTSTCSVQYQGFTKQADCAASTLSRSLDSALTSEGTASGWKKGVSKRTEDDILITPKNAATAALYTYTPWVGESGGGKQGVGGTSLYYDVWKRFAQAIGYSSPASKEVSDTTTDESDSDDAVTTPTKKQVDTTTDETDEGTDVLVGDAGAPKKSGDVGNGKSTVGGNPNNDDLSAAGNAPSSSGNGKSKTGGESRATEADLAIKKKSTGGCSSTGTTGEGAPVAGIAMVLASAFASRRRRKTA